MNRPTRPTPAPWIVRLKTGGAPRPPVQRPATPPSFPRPGIAARWKPRDRVRTAGN